MVSGREGAIQHWRKAQLMAAVVLMAVCGAPLSGAEHRDADKTVKQAMQDFRERRLGRARAELEAALEAHPDHAPSHHLLGLTLALIGEDELARSHLLISLRLAPDRSTYAVNTAKFLLRRGETEAAESVLEKSLSTAPSATALEMLGLIHLGGGRAQRAATVFEQALSVESDRVSTWYYRGLAYSSMGRYDDALESYENVLTLSPTDGPTLLQIGRIYLGRGRYRSALGKLQAAREVRPEWAEIHIALSQAQLAVGRLAAAAESAERAVTLQPESARAHYQLGQVLTRQGLAEEAGKHFALFERHRESQETQSQSLASRWRRSRRRPVP